MNNLSEVENLTFLLFLLRNLMLWYQNNIRLNSRHYFIMKIPNKSEPQSISSNLSMGELLRGWNYLYLPCLKPVWVILETPNFTVSAHRYAVSENNTFSTRTHLSFIDVSIFDLNGIFNQSNSMKIELEIFQLCFQFL